MLIKLIFIFINSYGWEVDNYHCRFEELSDVSAPLNQEVNRRIQEVITTGLATDPRLSTQIREQNEFRRRVLEDGMSSLTGKEPDVVRFAINRHKELNGFLTFEEAMQDWMNNPEVEPAPQPLVGCNQNELLSALRTNLASEWMGNLEEWAIDQSFDKCKPETTIYDGFGVMDAPMLRTVGVNPVIRVGANRIGVDKLSHFMTEGFDYYQAQRNNSNLSSILQLGQSEENGSYGLRTTGIKSYGDLTANYSGYLFWRQIFEGENPYLVCQNNRWVQKRSFNWNDYVNPLFDESVNCSEYKTENMQNIVDANTRSLTSSNDLGTRVCPLDTTACRNANTYFENPVVLNSILGPRCRALANGLNESIQPERSTGSETNGAQ